MANSDDSFSQVQVSVGVLKSQMEAVRGILDGHSGQLQAVRESQGETRKDIALIMQDLRVHIKRSDELERLNHLTKTEIEARIKPLEESRIQLKTVVAIALGVGGIIGGIIELMHMILRLK